MFRPVRPGFFAAIILIFISAACSPQLVPVTGGTLQPTATLFPTPESPNSIAILQSVPLGPPAMQAGSVYRYFDGSLLDAVPNDGPFAMGGGPDAPQHQVTVSDFWIYSTEVSNQMYAWCVSLGKCTPPDKKDNPTFQDAHYPNYPVVGVNWQQAADYCGFAHGRLPTEAEWEKAASWDASAKQARAYPWGNQDPSCDLLNFKNCYGKTSAVLQFGQGSSFYNVFNMEGNVGEWVGDWFKPNYQDIARDPHGPETGVVRSIRGSAFDSDASVSSPVRRFSAQPSAHRNNLGFRCVVQDPAYYAPYCQMPVFYGISSNGAAASNPCPDPSIEHTQVCALDHTVRDNITVHSSGSTIVQVSGLDACDPGTNSLDVRNECKSGTTVTVTASCAAVASGAVTCPPNYSPDPNHPGECVAPGAPGSCSPGFQYDQSLQCCSAIPGNSAAIPLCSVGQHLYNGACVDDSTGLQEPHSITYTVGPQLSCVPGLPVGATITSTAVPTHTPLPTSTPVPPTNTPVPPTNTPLPTNTPVPTNTPKPTKTPTLPPPPTNTPPPPTDTQAPPTNTDVPPTNPPPPTNTDVPPTNPPPPTNTDAPPPTNPPPADTPVDTPAA